MMDRQFGVTKYESIRRYLELIYLYGFLSREDWIVIGTVKDYDKMLSLLRELYPELEKDAIWQNRRKYLRFQRNYSESIRNPLLNSYLLCNLSAEELSTVLLILSLLYKRPCTLRDLTFMIETHSLDECSELYHTVRRRVQELEHYGYVAGKRESRDGHVGRYYSFCGDVLAPCDESELRELLDYVQFSVGSSPMCVAGSFLERSLARRITGEKQKLPILVRHQSKHSVLDEDAVYLLLDAIHARKYVSVQLSGREEATRFLPVQIRFDRRLGRWYLLSMDTDGPKMCRIAAMKKLRITGDAEDAAAWDRAASMVEDAFRHSVFSGKASEETLVTIEAELHFDQMPGMQEQFIREIRVGSICETDGRLCYRAEVSDPQAMVPFLRSYAPWLRICPGAHHIDRLIREDLLQIRNS